MDRKKDIKQKESDLEKFKAKLAETNLAKQAVAVLTSQADSIVKKINEAGGNIEGFEEFEVMTKRHHEMSEDTGQLREVNVPSYLGADLIVISLMWILAIMGSPEGRLLVEVPTLLRFSGFFWFVVVAYLTVRISPLYDYFFALILTFFEILGKMVPKRGDKKKKKESYLD